MNFSPDQPPSRNTLLNQFNDVYVCIPRQISPSVKPCWVCHWAGWTTNADSVDPDRRWRNTAAVALDRLSTWPTNALGRCARVVRNSTIVESLSARSRSLEPRPRCNGYRHSTVFVPRCNNKNPQLLKYYTTHCCDSITIGDTYCSSKPKCNLSKESIH